MEGRPKCMRGNDDSKSIHCTNNTSCHLCTGRWMAWSANRLRGLVEATGRGFSQLHVISFPSIRTEQDQTPPDSLFVGFVGRIYDSYNKYEDNIKSQL
jgi:hypothetical protein